jgi:hypothetical protein
MTGLRNIEVLLVYSGSCISLPIRSCLVIVATYTGIDRLRLYHETTAYYRKQTQVTEMMGHPLSQEI